MIGELEMIWNEVHSFRRGTEKNHGKPVSSRGVPAKIEPMPPEYKSRSLPFDSTARNDFRFSFYYFILRKEKR